MENEFGIVLNILQGLCLLEGLVFGAYMILRSKKDNGDLYLGLFLITMVTSYIAVFINSNSFLDDQFVQLSRMWYWPLNFHFAQFPLLFLYLRWLVLRKRFSFSKHANFFVPAVLEFLFLSILFFSSYELRNERISDENYNAAFAVIMILVFLFNIYMYYVSTLVIKYNQSKIDYSNLHLRKNLKWFKYASFYKLGFGAIFVIYWFLPDWDPWLYIIMTILDLVFIFWIIFFAISQKSSRYLLEKIEVKDPRETNIEELVEIEKDTYSNIPLELSNIIQNIKDQELYKNPELSINELANKNKISSKKLSNIINQHTDGNYNAFINGFRINEAKRMILSGEYDHLSMESIAYTVGFKSVATFYRAFKLKTDYSPMELKEKT